MYAIETQGLTKVYKKFFSLKKISALEDLDLAVPTGSIFGFLGLNGAGKTTTIKMLLGLSHPSRGEGWVLGKRLGDVEAKGKIGFLPEEAYFQRHLNSTEFLDFCGRTLHMNSEARKKRIGELLELVGLKDKAKTKLLNFSKGMLQRIGVAQALMNEPDLVIFDEPLTGLDPVGRTQLKEIMKGLKREGKTVFFSSHILSDVQEICDWVTILNKGQRIFQGKIYELLHPDHYEIRAASVPATVVEEIEKVTTELRKEGQEWIFSAENETARDRIVELLHKNSLKEMGISVSYAELEPVFLEKIAENNKERGIE